MRSKETCRECINTHRVISIGGIPQVCRPWNSKDEHRWDTGLVVYCPWDKVNLDDPVTDSRCSCIQEGSVE
jgi:hypothetical protein